MNARIATLLLVAAAEPMSAQTARRVQYHNPAWSPDGGTILFESDRDGKFGIYSIRSDGTGLRRLTPGDVNAVQPTWSPDGRRIVYSSEAHLYVMNADGSNPTRITNEETRKDFVPSFSPDAQWVTFGSQDAANRARYYINVVRADGTGRRELSDSSYVSEGPRWSADGTRILFRRWPMMARLANETPKQFMERRDKAIEKVSVRPDGSGFTRLTEEQYAAAERREANVSADGQWRAEAKTVDGAAGIYVIEIATGRERRLVSGPHS
jgi:Tol biopolymer transport system component